MSFSSDALFEYLAASRINVTGKGETQPFTKADDCKGAKSAKVGAIIGKQIEKTR